MHLALTARVRGRLLATELSQYMVNQATVLRDRRTADTVGLIFPTNPMPLYFDDGDASKPRAPERLYVAITRARHSVAFVVAG